MTSYKQFRFTLILNKRAVIVLFFVCLVIFISNINHIRKYYATMNERSIQELLDNVAKDLRYIDVLRKKDCLPKNLKYILLWTPKGFSPFYGFGDGQRVFFKSNCSVINCFVTDDKNFFDHDVTKFDAVAFNGRNIRFLSRYLFPKKRSPHQKYIYISTEAADYYPVCSKKFDGFFNWTGTYKLNSDILFSYVQIRNLSGHIVGPKENMEWAKNMSYVKDISVVQSKRSAVAWVVSNCKSRSKREEFAMDLQKHLRQHNLNLDIYGYCGRYKCSEDPINSCLDMLRRKYYFYLSLENAFSEDYVTEKLLTALNYDMIPIVYGGANYSRFLPPNTYLDALRLSPRELADTIAHLISSPEQYVQYFSWKSQYMYSDQLTIDSVCAVCAALNNKTMTETITVYDEFRVWWNPNYRRRCNLR